ncbi:hypothetical protein BD324DRAFT_623472 [Kockovaella imperatae]|uniref:Uncharacterized protein n=1 Tax=Kockovaella imperatae TaxID=4999 RepID=A0A1Y1UIF7_9TREE|nr:hypothetical protein BD324DRAFT_623472 [Kockovaella imperatae]ORX37828.1 hypothetical protein BD324DRAFT_623472 [Kockovaella imperatae]
MTAPDEDSASRSDQDLSFEALECLILRSKLLAWACPIQVDPSNPSAPPRRIIEKVPKASWWNRTFGGQTHTEVTSHGSIAQMIDADVSRLDQTRRSAINSHSAAQQLGAAPQLYSYTPCPQPSASAWETNPYYYAHGGPRYIDDVPLNFASLPLAERMEWERVLGERAKMSKHWRKVEEKKWKAEQKELERKMKQEMKLKRQKLKAEQAKQLAAFSGRKRWLPSVSSAPGAGARRVPAGVATSPMPGVAVEPQTRWMMLPTGEEFGVRRPFDGPGRPPIKGPGDWPMMSRTMTHVSRKWRWLELSLPRQSRT